MTSLSQYSSFTSLWTAQSKYIIDFQRGLVTHSKTLSKGQFNRLVGNKPVALRPQLNSRQAFNHYTNYLLGEKFLLFLKTAHNNELSKLFFQASLSYAMNHKDEFQKVQNQLAYPVVQMPYGGFVRTKLERHNIAEYVEKLVNKANFYGMFWWNRNQKEDAETRTYENLRNIAFKKRHQHVQVATPQEDSDQ